MSKGAKGTKPESRIQKEIIDRLEKDGYMVVKILLCNKPGFPDLMALKDGKAIFIEVKRPGEKPRPLQAYRISELIKFGFDVRVMSE